ncbi:eukaryotic small stress protein PASS1 [Legionella gratiana]|uniref:Eukaryotic small stress protein n=1 Tax=Legionella gratiana TaxID=45066 RepID=A0A378J147_9GAMM|nr:cupin-like domain-containing protein [Legionella gratiana]KTD11519.1 eukaryotic small stress protein PASS1 [Legionella gratiana]STX41463.1 eukaryotic small stress protein [Legionella gratiana]
MQLKKIRVLEYEYGYEELIMKILYNSKEPMLIKIKNFTDKFSLDYFIERFSGKTIYSVFENNIHVDNQSNELKEALIAIKENKPYRIFSQIFSRNESAKIECHVPLWQKFPLRPRFFNKDYKVGYYFGGNGAHTEMHYDREHCCNLHLCLSGKKELLLFTQDQSDNIYKLPFISNSFIDFGHPKDFISKKFPRINKAEGYQVVLEKGDMLFMPRNCWHYTTYLEPSTSATYVFYPNKFFHLYGYLTGHFFCGFKDHFRISEWPWFKKFSQNYALAAGWKKIYFKMIEKALFTFMFLPISIYNMISK